MTTNYENYHNKKVEKNSYYHGYISAITYIENCFGIYNKEEYLGYNNEENIDYRRGNLVNLIYSKMKERIKKELIDYINER